MDEQTRELILRLSTWIKILAAIAGILMVTILFLLNKMGKLKRRELWILIALGLVTFTVVLFFSLK